MINIKKMYFSIGLLILGLTPILAEPCGDVNSNGQIDIVDALMIAQYYVGLDPQNFDQGAADVSGDSAVSIVDALQVAQFYVGLTDLLAGCTVSPTTPPPPIIPETIFAVNCGGDVYTSSDGTEYSADTRYSGGSAYSHSDPVQGTVDEPLYQSERYGDCNYSVEIPEGYYLVTLHFAETYHTSAGARSFNILIEGKEIFSDLDIYAEAGGNAAFSTETYVTVSDGEINIDFMTNVENAKINAIKVTLAGPRAEFSYSPAMPLPGRIISFDASASGHPNGAIADYSWDFGDGSSGGGRIASHTYPAAGDYQVTLSVIDNDGYVGSITGTVTVYTGDPIAVFSISPSNPKPGDTVTVDASASYDPDGSITGYSVNYGDGTILSGAVTTHLYAGEGEYTITVTVTDNSGGTDSLSKSISLREDRELCNLGRDVADRIAYNTLGRGPSDTYYAVACVWYGTLVYAGLVEDSTLINGSANVYYPQQPTGSVDDNIFGIWPLGLYEQTNNSGYRDTGLYLANEEYNPPAGDGLCKYTRFWVDDLYMICSLQIQAYKATGDSVYLDRSAAQFEAYFNALQQPNGLFHHTRSSPNFWGRGNGWAASAMTETLMVMPEDHPEYGLILNRYKLMMSALAGYQDPTGMWHQVINMPSSYLETSCTGMFLFAMATGIRMGWLPESEYFPVVERGFSALAGYVNSSGATSDICIGTGQSSGVQYYLDRPRSTGDYHGQAAVLWAATAVMRLCN